MEESPSSSVYGLQMKYGIAPAPRKKRAVPQCFVTEMKHSYKHPQKLAKLKNNTSRYGCNTLHGVYAKGIVPTMVHDNKHNQETKKPLATKSRQTGGKTVDNHGMLTSPQPSEHQQLSGCVAGTDKQVLEAAVQSPAPSSPVQGMEYLPAVHYQVSEHVPTWISEWPGPL
ncbi:testis-expressed protein 26-like isoform X1 [Scleropages formosus]|uniref:testis-expressed protein 26-like isoform X1 n=2 Tax=Scleropages formosus TaxID=113540 RepID=UPI0010FA865F|nr:testis-expressed protein 26-like isoform X1 [Scleropages formosus]